MISVYINGTEKPNIKVLTGGNLTENQAHQTSSTMTIKMPLTESISENDYIKIMNDDDIIFSGVILKYDLQTINNSELSYKKYSLTIASNAELITNVMFDNFYDAGCTMDEILNGTNDGGLLGKIANELGTDIGTVDNFSQFSLETDTSFYGMYINDVLDQLCDISGAYWEITKEKVFNMRYKGNIVVSDKKLKNIVITGVSHDAFNEYSAVRVIGGTGKGCGCTEEVASWTTEFNKITDNGLELRYPIHSVENTALSGPNSTLGALYWADNNLNCGVMKIGVNGLHDNNSEYGALFSYGSNVITIKSMPSGADYFSVAYYPCVKIATRLDNSDLASEIKNKRGGTGTIEYLLKDNTINSYEQAVQSGVEFLKTCNGVTSEFTFTTYESGYNVGDTITDCNESYFGIKGDYKIVEIKQSIVNDTLIKSTVKCSNSDFRDNNKILFQKSSKQTFVIKNEVPPSSGKLYNSDIKLQSTLTFTISNGLTWAEIDALDETWSQKDALGKTWAEIDNNQGDDITVMGQYAETTLKNKIAGALNGQNMSIDANASAVVTYTQSDASGENENTYTKTFTPTTTVSGNQLITTFTMPSEVLQADMYLEKIEYKDADGNITETVTLPTDITQPVKKYNEVLTIAKKDEVL